MVLVWEERAESTRPLHWTALCSTRELFCESQHRLHNILAFTGVFCMRLREHGEVVVHSDDLFAPVCYLKLHKLSLKDKTPTVCMRAD